MAKGVKKIKWVPRENDAKVFPTLSIANKLLVIEPNKWAWFEVSEWEDGTTPLDKKKDITWMRQNSNRKEVLNYSYLKAEHFYGVKLPKKLCGVYTYYIEASLLGKRDFANDTGLKVRGHCEAKIISSKWCVTNDGEDQRSKQFKYGHLVYLNLETEGLNGVNNLIVDVFKIVEGGGGTSDDKHVATYTNVQVIDGEVNLKMGNTSSWFVHARNDIEKFYVKVKTGNRYITDGKDAIHARFLQMKRDLVTSAFEPSTNQTPLKVGESTKNFYSPILCKYEKITIHDKDSNKEPFDITVYEEKTTKLTQLYETVASSDEGKSKLDITFEKFKTQKCYTKPNHKQEVEIYINNIKQKTEIINGGKYSLPIEAEANKILLRTHPELFFLTPDTITQYKLVTKTCAKPNNPIIINVYPNVEREVAFILSLLKTYSKENNTKISHQENLTEYGKDYALKYIRNVKETLIQTKGGFGYALQAKVKVDNVVSLIELGKTRSQIKTLIDFYYKVEECISIFDGGKAEGTPDKYIRKPGIKWTFDIEPPNIALALRMTNKKISNTNEVVTQFIGGFAFKPIIKFKFGVDILSLLQYFGLGGKIADWLKNEIEKKYEFTLYVIVEASLEARGEFTLNYNKIEGFAKGKRKLEVECVIGVKGGAKSTGDKNMVIVYVPEADGILQKVKVEKWKAEATAAAVFTYTIEAEADSKGQYRQHKLEFSGIKATIIVYAIRQGMQYNETFKKEFTIVPKPDEPWFKSDKEYII